MAKVSVDHNGGMAEGSRPRVLVLHATDNVAVAVAALEPGETLPMEAGLLLVREAIPFGHKVALRDIPAEAAVIKYGEVIGKATQAIAAGRHVHVHNVVSARLPGPRGSSPSPLAALKLPPPCGEGSREGVRNSPSPLRGGIKGGGQKLSLPLAGRDKGRGSWECTDLTR